MPKDMEETALREHNSETAVFPDNWNEALAAFLEQPEIKVMKKTKRSEKEVDIKPMIYQFEARDEEIYMQVATGSVENLKPELVMQAFSQFLGLNAEEITFVHHRLEVYANIGTEDNRELVSLDQVS